MPLEVLGFEGPTQSSTGIAWGAAAIKTDGRIVNSITAKTVTKSAYSRSVQDGAVYELSTPLKIPDEYANQPLIVLRISVNLPARAVKPLTTGSCAKWNCQDSGHSFWVFADPTEFTLAAGQSVTVLAGELLFKKRKDARQLALIRAGLSLDKSNPEINALWAFRKQTSISLRIAKRHLDGPEALRIFEDTHASLMHAHQKKRLEAHFEGSEFKNGISLPRYASLLDSFGNLFAFEVANTQRHYQAEEPIKPLVVAERRAASLHLTFSTENEETYSFEDRLAHALVWRRLMGRLLRSDQSQADSSFTEARRVLAPPTGCELRVSVPGYDEDQLISPTIVKVPTHRWSKQLSLSDAQIVRSGYPIRYLRLTKSNHAIDLRTWFRDALFGQLDWRAFEWNNKTIEGCIIPIHVLFDSVDLGEQRFQLSHDPDRARSHEHPTTWLHWNQTMLAAFKSGFYGHHWVTIERYNGDSFLMVFSRTPAQSRT